MEENNATWTDLVRIKGHKKIYEITLPVDLIDHCEYCKNYTMIDKYYKDRDPIYDCDPYFNEIAKRFQVSRDDLETYMFGDIDISDIDISLFDFTQLGGKINNIIY